MEIAALVERLWRNKVAKGFNVTDPELEFEFLEGELDELRLAVYPDGDGTVDTEWVGEEIADVVLFALSLARVYGLDPEQILDRKMEINEGRTYVQDPATGRYVKVCE